MAGGEYVLLVHRFPIGYFDIVLKNIMANTRKVIIMTEKQKRMILFKLFENGEFYKEQDIVHHFRTNVFRHSISVARLSLKIAEKLHLKVNEEDLLTGALLHDYFLYDWHEKKLHHKLHGFIHAKIAADNAKRDYNINDKVYNIIYSHMFPLNLTHIPRCKEAWIVTIADKYVALKEQSAILKELFPYQGRKPKIFKFFILHI